MSLEFEWDDDKATANLRKHGISFELAKDVFKDYFAVAAVDDRDEYGEERFLIVGIAAEKLLSVVYTERGDKIRIISARKANSDEQEKYIRTR
jgi:uncharacterized DUF497 family protein